jgi:hypothetical protein
VFSLPLVVADWRGGPGLPRSSLRQWWAVSRRQHRGPPDPASLGLDLVVARRRRMDGGGDGGRRGEAASVAVVGSVGATDRGWLGSRLWAGYGRATAVAGGWRPWLLAAV